MTQAQSKKRSGVSAAAWIVGLSMAVFALAQCVNPVPASDLYWQLRTGEWIAAHGGAPPHFDPFSWTRFHAPWVVHEWLCFLMYWEAYRLGHFGGVWLLVVALMVPTWLVHYRSTLRETAAPITAFVLSAGAATLCGPFFQPRPQLFTYLFSLTVLGMALQVRREADAGDGSGGRRLWLLVPLFALWANLHAGVLIGVGILGLFACGDYLALRFGRIEETSAGRATRMSLCKTLALVTIAGFAATLLTPYTYHEYENFAATVTNTTMLNTVAEWSSPDFHQTFGRQVETLLAVIVFSLFCTRLRRDYTEIALLVILAHEALAADRNVPLLAILGTVVIARHVQSTIVRFLFQDNQPPTDSLFGSDPPVLMAGMIGVTIAVCAITQASATVRLFGPPTGSYLQKIGLTIVGYGSYPERACEFIERERFPREMHMYNIYGDGGFLIWRLRDHPDYIDGRADVYFGAQLDRYRKMNSLPYDWRGSLDKRGVDFIVASASERQTKLFLTASDWALVYADRGDIDKDYNDYARQNNTLIFVRRDPKYAALITQCQHDCPIVTRIDLKNPHV